MIIGLSLLLFALSAVAFAQIGGGYDLSWNTIDGGGGTATGGSYMLDGAIGQPDAGALSGGAYTLNGGFWQIAGYTIYAPAVQR
jgi:hypothetical protein